MTLLVLFDLDDTLLENDIQPFVQRYFTLLATTLADSTPKELFLRAMQLAVQAMLTKQLPAGTLQNTFDEVFYPALGVSKVDLAGKIEEFYRTEYPRLQPLTRQKPDAIQLVKDVIGRGWQVVVATNPLFPRTAIEQRLEWAGMPVNQFPFALVTTYENSHFCKPNPAYYAEILALLRWPQIPAVMIGNSLQDDILPAEQLGMPTYWLCEETSVPTIPNRHPLSKTGPMKEVLPWLENIAQASPIPSFDTIPAILATLQSTPAVLESFSLNFPYPLWNKRPEPKEWCFTEILCHLRDVDREVNLDRIDTVLKENRPFLQAAMTDGWVEARKCINEDGKKALLEFIKARSDILLKLLELSENDWQRPARHAIFGPTTLKELVGFIATHDRIHINQAWQAIQAVL